MTWQSFAPGALPTTNPRDTSRGFFRPSCCKTPYMCRTQGACACHYVRDEPWE